MKIKRESFLPMDQNNNTGSSSIPSAPAPANDLSVAPAEPAAPASDPSMPSVPAAPPVSPVTPIVPPQVPSSPVPAPDPTPTPMPQSNPATSGIPQAGGASPAHPHHKTKMLWVIILLVFSFFCGLFIAAWYFQTQLQKAMPVQKDSMKAPVTMPKKLVIGTDATFPPMEDIASEGAYMGYDIDLGNRIGKELGVEVEFKNIPWDNIFKALENKEIDMIMSSVTITEEQKQKYDFSESYLNTGQVVIARQDTTIASAAALQGKKIAVQQGTTNETEALKLTSANLVVRYPDFEQATKALVNGTVDAILSDLPGAKGIITANPTLKIATDPFTNEYYGIAFRKGDPNIKKINEVLSSLRTQGILTDLKQKWLD